VIGIDGEHTGGRCFGYRNVPIEEAARVDQHGRPLIMGVRIEVREDLASVVRRIFQMYADGNSLQIPEQRVLSEELWNAVEARIETVKQIYGEIGRKGGMQGRSVSSPYVFSGLLKCSECGAISASSLVDGAGAVMSCTAARRPSAV
jgi:hypothetical protein